MASAVFSRTRIMSTVGLMGITGAFLVAAIIINFDPVSGLESEAAFGTKAELAARTFMPYMISALVAAVTAVGIMTIMPIVRTFGADSLILHRLKGLGSGDLASTVPGSSNNSLSEIAGEMNTAIERLNSHVTQLKVINRSQWDVLCDIRAAAESNDCAKAIEHIDRMEVGWEKLAEVESHLQT